MNPHIAVFNKLFGYALANSPDELAVMPLRMLMKGKPKFGKRPPHTNGSPAVEQAGSIQIALPNESVMDLRAETGDAWYIVRVRRSVIERIKSPILMPGEKR